MWPFQKLPKVKKKKLDKLELAIVNYLCDQIDDAEVVVKIKKQVEYLTRQRRINYKKDIVIEVYPEVYDGIPGEFLFGRTEEFAVAKVQLEINGIKHTSRISAVSGKICEISIKPVPAKGGVEFKSIKIEKNLYKNIYG